MNRDLGKISVWSDLWGKKLNESQTKTMILSRSRPLTIGGTVLKKSDDLDISGVTFDSKMTLEKHLRSVSTAASHRVGILRKSWQVFMIGCFWGVAFGGLSSQFWSTVLQCGARLQIHTLNYWIV